MSAKNKKRKKEDLPIRVVMNLILFVVLEFERISNVGLGS
jgi:hypothetical protein